MHGTSHLESRAPLCSGSGQLESDCAYLLRTLLSRASSRPAHSLSNLGRVGSFPGACFRSTACSSAAIAAFLLDGSPSVALLRRGDPDSGRGVRAATRAEVLEGFVLIPRSDGFIGVEL